jgi:hypothetical protein
MTDPHQTLKDKSREFEMALIEKKWTKKILK